MWAKPYVVKRPAEADLVRVVLPRSSRDVGLPSMNRKVKLIGGSCKIIIEGHFAWLNLAA